MQIEKFIELFHEQLEETELNLLTPATKFRELEEWSSLIALSIIAIADDEYNIELKGDDIDNSNTLEDIFNIIKLRV